MMKKMMKKNSRTVTVQGALKTLFSIKKTLSKGEKCTVNAERDPKSDLVYLEHKLR